MGQFIDDIAFIFMWKRISSFVIDLILYYFFNRNIISKLINFSRQVTRDRAIEFQKNNKIDAFFETSAKTGNNVEEVFALAAKQLYSIHKRDTVIFSFHHWIEFYFTKPY